MKRISIACIAFFAFAAISFGQVNFGAGITFAADGGGFLGVQGKVLYNLDDIANQPMDAAGTFSYFFVDGGSLWSIDLDGHYELLTLGDDITLSPIAGLNIARASVNAGGFGNIGNTEVGINLGANFKIPINDFMIYAEPKIAFGGIGGFVISGGLLF